jgi:cytochrome c oxidase cbb3-type subunit 1
LLGGFLFFSGMLIMAFNVYKTIAAGKAYDAPIPDAIWPGSVPMPGFAGQVVAQGD